MSLASPRKTFAATPPRSAAKPGGLPSPPAIVPGAGWAVEFLINDGARQVELKGFLGL